MTGFELHKCERDEKASVSEKHCISRQEFLAKFSPKNGYVGGQYRDINDFCGGCKTGLEIYDKHLKGEKITMEKPETKTCPCGKVFERLPGQKQSSWGKAKYCPDHAAMNSYQRDKDIKRLILGKAHENSEEVEGHVTSTSVEKPSQVEPETKPCSLEGCENPCVRKPGESQGSWVNRKYCNPKCAAEARRRRERVSGRSKVTELFDREKAEGIARDAADTTMEIFSAFISDTMTHDQIKAVAIQTGIECQRRAAGAA